MRLFPKNFDFFKLFDAQAEKLLEAARVVDDLEKNNDIKKQARKMKKVEKEADDITHESINSLNKTFITPIEREDITFLASSLDNIVDELERAFNRLSIYEIDPLPIEVFRYGDIIQKALEEVSRGVRQLKESRRREQEFLKRCELINLIENRADDLHRGTLGKLFTQEKDPIKIIKLREIYEALENVTDSCENAANALETIVIKNF